MKIPARTLRNHAQQFDRTPVELTQRDQKLRDRILATGGDLLARNGSHTITETNLAIGLNISVGVLRRHFADIDALLAELLRRHLRQVIDAISVVAHTDPDSARKRRAAYFAATHTNSGAFTQAHWLLVRDRHLLPAEERGDIDTFRQQIGQVIAGPMAEQALTLLDTECLSLTAIEAALAAIIADIADAETAYLAEAEVAAAKPFPWPENTPAPVPNRDFIPPPGWDTPDDIPRAILFRRERSRRRAAADAA